MNDLQRHAVVLGVALVLAAGIFAVRTSSSGGGAAPAAVRPADRPGPNPAPGRRDGAAAAPVSPSVNQEALDRVRSLMAETREILELAGMQDDNQARLVQAGKNVEECQALLEGLPQGDPDVVTERQHLQELRLDVVKVSGL